MLTVEGRWDAHFRLTLGREHQAFGRVNQNTVGKIGTDVEESKSGEDVNCIFFAAEHRQAEVAHQRMAELMTQYEESVANHKLDQPLALVRVKGRNGSRETGEPVTRFGYANVDRVFCLHKGCRTEDRRCDEKAYKRANDHGSLA
jgi:hypothetical protein